MSGSVARVGSPPDPMNMRAHVVGLPQQLRDAHAAVARASPLVHGPKPSRILVVGMGGSAIGGDFLRQIARERCPAPVDVVRDDRLPHLEPSTTFAFFVSYSGNTEETLSCWDQAARMGLRCAAITSGGRLAERAQAERAPLFTVPGGLPPRAALGWTAVPLVVSLEQAELLPKNDEEWEEAFAVCATLAREASLNGPRAAPLDAWARVVSGRLVMIYAASVPTGPAAVRWSCQINENAKMLAHVALFPEQNHNEIMGWEGAGAQAAGLSLVVLEDPGVSPGVRRRLAHVSAEIQGRGVHVERFSSIGRGLTARLFSLALLGDFASLALAGARGVDPTPVASIERLKASLASGTIGDSTT